MRKLPLIAVFVLLFSFSGAGEGIREKPLGLSIKTVDEKSDAFRVQTVRWWYSGKRNTKNQLECEIGLCDEWAIEEEISGSIVISAAVSIVKENDEQCWDLYAGETVVEMPSREVTIVVAYVSMVCK